MKRVRAFDKNTGAFVQIMNAAAMDESQRRAFIYKCLNTGCDCRLHWRRPVYRYENSVAPDPATFVKNPSSSHIPGCRYDYERIARANHSYCFVKDGQFHLRCNFPLGSSKNDLYPARPQSISQEHGKRARANSDKYGLGSVCEMVKFLEKQFGSLEDPALQDLILYYQGHQFPWTEVFAGSGDYGALYEAAWQRDENGLSPERLTVVRVEREIEPNKHGKPRFSCTLQYGRANQRDVQVQPILVADRYENDLVQKLRESAQTQATMLVSARPFTPESATRYKVKPVYLFTSRTAQVSRISPDYWKPAHMVDRQLGLFKELKV